MSWLARWFWQSSVTSAQRHELRIGPTKHSLCLPLSVCLSVCLCHDTHDMHAKIANNSRGSDTVHCLHQFVSSPGRDAAFALCFGPTFSFPSLLLHPPANRNSTNSVKVQHAGGTVQEQPMSDKDSVSQAAVQPSLKSIAHNLLCSSSRSSLASISRFALMARCTRLRHSEQHTVCE